MPSPSSHAYLRTHEISGQILRFRLPAEEQHLREQAGASKSGRAAKTLVKEGPLRITEVALRKGTLLPSHQVAGATSLEIRRGRLRVTAAGGTLDFGPGELVVLNTGVAHAVQALSDCVVLITMAMR